MPNLKRGHENDEDDEHSAQKAKKQKQLSAFEKCKERTIQLQDAMTDLDNFLTNNSLVDDSACDDMKVLSSICNAIMRKEENGGVPLHQVHADVLSDPLDVLDDNALAGMVPKRQRHYKSMVHIVNELRSEVCDLYQELLKEETYPPSASDYAKPTEWVKWQTKPTAILNLRPSNNLGLPLATLHPIFARFNAVLQQSLPEHSDTATAYCAAFSLCIDMAGSFKNEVARRDAFESCVKPLFPGYSFIHEVILEPTENSTREYPTSKADTFVYGDQGVIMGVGFKAEFTGDAYMEVSRIYQTWVNRQLDKKDPGVSHGLPMVIICVIGPLLIPAGGFFDGTSVIVEPLAPPCLMLPDHLQQRQETLARVLAATKEAMQSISRLKYDIPASFVPGTPRVYSTFSTFENVTTELTFNSRLPFNRSQDPHRNLLFLATSPISTSQVLVKLIVGDRYGTEAHKILAKAEFAPALYGTAKVQGAPTAYVMEYLSPKDGWKTLHEHVRQHDDVKSHILAPLRLIVAEMEKHDIVHGDFRPNNIMIRRKGAGDDYELRIIDFDWAGENGKVNYPWCRNEDISWPGQPNDPIVIPHDRKLLESYLDPKGNDSWLGIPEGLTGSPA